MNRLSDNLSGKQEPVRQPLDQAVKMESEDALQASDNWDNNCLAKPGWRRG